MRAGCETAQIELDCVEEEVKTAETMRNEAIHSLQGVLDDLKYKVSVATDECGRWTDNTL